MKRFLSLILLLCVGGSANAQYILTPDGFKPGNGKDEVFMIVEYENKSQQELYDAALSFVNKAYNSPNFVLSNVTNDMLTIIIRTMKTLRPS